MARVAIVFGILLILLGVGAYGLALAGVIGDKVSITALIPAFAGILFVILGGIGVARPSANKHVMHAAAALALLAFFGTVSGVIKLIRYLTDSLPPDSPIRPSAWVAQSIMALLMLVFVILCVRSFIAARRDRALETPAGA